MNYEQIIKAVDSGKSVFWSHEGYRVIKDKNGKYLIHCVQNEHYVGLKSHTVNGYDMTDEEMGKFFIKEGKQ